MIVHNEHLIFLAAWMNSASTEDNNSAVNVGRAFFFSIQLMSSLIMTHLFVLILDKLKVKNKRIKLQTRDKKIYINIHSISVLRFNLGLN